ncbi:MAG: formylglycine-generating enzyme family protein, partial [Prosthecobacter sp.]|nr:formylglycine-generating enzyme family protein [Prosthecobacter sp.]
TQAQWLSVMGANLSDFKGPQRPAESVDWHQSAYFAAKLNALLPGLHAALPSEAQWEYACRAGTQNSYHDGSTCTQPEGEDPALKKLGWFDKNSGGETHAVKLKDANAWGLHDMHGNVWEWCRDAWDETAYVKRGKTTHDPETEDDDESAFRVVRGGSWYDQSQTCRAAFRGGHRPGDRGINQGLRLAAGQEPTEPLIMEELSDLP